jgi:hypothetical protein
MSGFSEDAVNALVARKVVNTILFDGDDIRAVAAGEVGFAEALDRKLRDAAEIGIAFSRLGDPVSGRLLEVAGGEDERRRTRVVIVEGYSDALLVHALANEFGPSPYQLEVLPAGGMFNLAALATAASAARNGEPVIIIADGDGHPEAVRHQIEGGLDGLSSGSVRRPSIFVFDPTFEEALGVLEGLAGGRRRGPELDLQLWREKLRSVDIRRVAESSPEVKRLLTTLGIRWVIH